MVDWDTVRELALALPEAEETGGDRIAFQVRGKSFAWAARERDGGGLGIRVERDEKAADPRLESGRVLLEPALRRVARSPDPPRGDRPRRAARTARGGVAHPGAEATGGRVRGGRPADERLGDGSRDRRRASRRRGVDDVRPACIQGRREAVRLDQPRPARRGGSRTSSRSRREAARDRGRSATCSSRPRTTTDSRSC